jgi:uncharacterized ferritin-like protein (DUF455 family)
MASLSLRRQALLALLETDPGAKAAATRSLGASLAIDPAEQLQAPAHGLPGRPNQPVLVGAQNVPARSVGTRQGRAALIHSLAHIEFNAINLALDAIWRFNDMPPAYYTDWLKVAHEEACHFGLLHDHLQTLGHVYGDFPAHDGLWEMAERTQDDLLARMALVPRTLEARGLDASPIVRTKLANAGDHAAAAIIDIILHDEIGHVAIGNHWYRHVCHARNLDPEQAYQNLALHYRAPRLRGPFNFSARRQAGFSETELRALQASAHTVSPPHGA